MPDSELLQIRDRHEIGQSSVDFGPYESLISQEMALIPAVTVDDTIRVKVLDRCGMTCNFCHNEGTPVKSKTGFQALRVSIYSANNGMPFTQEDITSRDADSFRKCLADLRDQGLARELHWTGESLHFPKTYPN